MAAISGGGGYLEAKCRIEDLGGKPVSCRFVTMGQGTAEYSKDTLSASGPVMVEQALEPGEYTVRVVGKDGTEAVRTVSIVAGRTSECRVSLP